LGDGGGGVFVPTTPTGKELEFIQFTIVREVIAGETFALDATVRNPVGRYMTNLQVSILGMPENWVSVNPMTFNLAQKEETTIHIIATIPPGVAVGDYQMGIRVSNGNDTAERYHVLRVKDKRETLTTRPIVTREVKLDLVKKETRVYLYVQNGNNDIPEYQLVEEIPKTLAINIDEVTLTTPASKIIRKDPVLEWDVALAPYDTKTFEYKVGKVLDEYHPYIYWPVEQQTILERGPDLRIFREEIPPLTPGEGTVIAFNLIATLPKPEDAVISLDVPPDWKVEPSQISMRIQSGTPYVLNFTVTPAADANPGAHASVLKIFIQDRTYAKEVSLPVRGKAAFQFLLPFGWELLPWAAIPLIFLILALLINRTIGGISRYEPPKDRVEEIRLIKERMRKE
jgi:hypothetical protein